MSGWRRAGALFLVLLPFLPACFPGSDTEEAPATEPEGSIFSGHPAGERRPLPLPPDTMRDAEGLTVGFRSRPQRILSLVPSATQTLQALGAGSLLVGRTDYDTASALSHLPSVGGGLQPSLEVVVSLDPDLVIRFAGESDRVTPRRLARLGIQQFAVRPDRMADIRRTILDLGEITGFRDKATEMVAEMDSILQEIESRLQGRSRRNVAYLLGGNPPWAAGKDTFVEELIHVAGGANVFDDLEALYGPVSPEELMTREIDLVLIPEGSEVSLPGIDLPVTFVPASIELPGPYLADEAWRLATILHPEAFR